MLFRKQEGIRDQIISKQTLETEKACGGNNTGKGTGMMGSLKWHVRSLESDMGLHEFNVCLPQTINYRRTRTIFFVLCSLLSTQWSACHMVDTIKYVLNESLLYSLPSFDAYHIWFTVPKFKTSMISQLRIVKFKLLFKVHMDLLPRSLSWCWWQTMMRWLWTPLLIKEHLIPCRVGEVIRGPRSILTQW